MGDKKCLDLYSIGTDKPWVAVNNHQIHPNVLPEIAAEELLGSI